MQCPSSVRATQNRDPPALFADPSNANAVLGWSRRFNIWEIIASAVRWEERVADFIERPAKCG
jgi:UDP-glucose 4-epimerase